MKTETPNANKWAGAGMFTAIAASLCCITPALALVAGTGGIAASFSWLEPFRIYLVGITVVVLGFAWYLKLRSRKSGEIQCACEKEEKPSFRQSKMFLGLVTVLAVVMLSFPNYSGMLYSNDEKEVLVVKQDAIRTVQLNVKGLTCSGCDSHVVHAVMELDGVLEATSDHRTGKAIVKFDDSKTTKNKIVETIDATGYEVTK